ncbi:MAG: Ig domain-containing protein [Prevotella sp.]|nr:Ig domain-containing protein [Prevotella sp.]
MSFIIHQLSFGLALCFALSACGDLFEFEGNTTVGSKITLNRHDLYLMAGDTYQLTATFDPDTVRNHAIYWMSNNVNVARFDNGVLVAVGEGETTVTGISIEQQSTDTCHVVVGYEWGEIDPKRYPFDMVVYADITVDGQPLNDQQAVGAFVDNELRGVGVSREFHNIKCTELRIYSPLNPHGPYTDLNPQDPLYPDDTPYDLEKVVFRVYDREQHHMYECPDPLIFDGEAHGHPSNLYKISL